MISHRLFYQLFRDFLDHYVFRSNTQRFPIIQRFPIVQRSSIIHRFSDSGVCILSFLSTIANRQKPSPRARVFVYQYVEDLNLLALTEGQGLACSSAPTLVPSIDRIASVSRWSFICLEVAEIAAFQGFQGLKTLKYYN